MIMPFENVTTSFLLLFLAIVFLQSGFDKVFDWKNNLSWLKGHFANTLFKGIVPMLLRVVLITELAAGILSLGGLVESLLDRPGILAYSAGVTSCITLLMLLLGQRVAKDYDGARTLVIYFIPAVFLVFLLEF